MVYQHGSPFFDEAYEQIDAQMDEIMTSPFYTTYASHSQPQGKSESFLKGASKNMIIGAVVGVVIACGLWFLSALASEFRTRKEKDITAKEAAENER